MGKPIEYEVPLEMDDILPEKERRTQVKPQIKQPMILSKRKRIIDEKCIRSKHGIPLKVYENITRINKLSAEIKNLKTTIENNHGTLSAIYLDQLNISEEKPEMSIENVLGLLKDINERAPKIANNAINNVYHKKHEWYGSNKEYFRTTINNNVYEQNSIPLKPGYKNKEITEAQGGLNTK